MPHLGGSRKSSVRRDITKSKSVRMEDSSCSEPSTAKRQKRKKLVRVKAGALGPLNSQHLPVNAATTITPKDGEFRKRGNGIASGSGVKLARTPPFLNTADCQVKKSSLSRKCAGAAVITPIVRGGKTEASGSRKVKFSANVHTFPTNNTDKKERIGELHLKKPIKKLKRNRPLSSGGRSVVSKLDLSISQQPGSVLRKDVQQSVAVIDAEPVATIRDRKTLRSAPKAPVASASRKSKRLKNSRIKAGANNRQPVVIANRPCPRLAYSVQPEVKRDSLLPSSTAINKRVQRVR
ncbi:uncharacterized protein LOC111595716 isoform X2 [Drosophila hydei]|uniref:Uncharacterized protein LOC111595716 isoform X2 n=1 Tax=Drosophila hydei TaxID=7224 RepID=A0A6J1LEB2_DROHY|nr:uncharacterized protein LOC111595716 isoform X2 [Drosophila hydei]